MEKSQNGYDRAIEKVLKKYQAKYATERGAMSWLAKELGISKQAVNQAGNRGVVPPEWLEKMSEITGVSVPELLDSDVIAEVNDLSRKWRSTVHETEVALIRIGLDRLK